MIQIPDNIDSKYRFVILSALRARQIQGGSPAMIKQPSHKATQIAQKELIQGLVKFRVGNAVVGENSGEVEESAEE